MIERYLHELGKQYKYGVFIQLFYMGLIVQSLIIYVPTQLIEGNLEI